MEMEEKHNYEKYEPLGLPVPPQKWKAHLVSTTYLFAEAQFNPNLDLELFIC